MTCKGCVRVKRLRPETKRIGDFRTKKNEKTERKREKNLKGSKPRSLSEKSRTRSNLKEKGDPLILRKREGLGLPQGKGSPAHI